MDEKLKGAAAGAVAVTVGALFPSMVGAGGVKVAYDLYAFLNGLATDARLRAAAADLVREVAGLDDYDEEEAANRFIATVATCSPEVEDLLYQHHRTVFLGKSKAAWPYVLRLTADRISNHGGTADTFTRRAAWLLERCEDDDITLLNAALHATGESLAEFYAYAASNSVRRTYQWVQGGPGKLSISPYPGQEGTPKLRVIDAPSGAVIRPHEVVGLLADSRLGYADGTGAVNFELDDGNLDRLVELFRMRTR